MAPDKKAKVAGISKRKAQEEVAQPPKKAKKEKPRKSPTPEPSDEESSKEEEVLLHGFSSDDDDSSDEDNEPSAFDVEKLPVIAKDDATVQRKLEKAKKQPVSMCSLWIWPLLINKQTEERGIIYLGRIPHGFYEDQLRAYFSQFGTITRLRVSRNKKVYTMLSKSNMDLSLC